MKRATPLLPECHRDDAGASAQRDRDSNTEPSTAKEPFFWWNPPAGPDGFIVVTYHGLRGEFHASITHARWCLETCLEHLNNIRTATSSTSAPLGEVQVTNAIRLFPRHQEPVSNIPSSISTQEFDIDREREWMKKQADSAVLALRRMDEILDVIEMLPERSEPMFSTDVVLWTVACLILMVAFPFQLVRTCAALYTGFGTAELLRRPVFKVSRWYNRACVHQQVRDLVRALEDERISEKNRGDLNSWHLWAHWQGFM